MFIHKTANSVAICIALILIVLSAGCSSRDKEASADVKWVDLINELKDTERIARLDTLDSKLISSSDITRQNKDHNHFVRIEKKSGIDWIVIADIKGTGYVSRVWCTGYNMPDHKIRFYFNNERRPRINTTVTEFFGGSDPFLPPIATAEQNCWYSYLPIPFSERLIIMIEEKDRANGQQVKDYHHINYSMIQDGSSIQTFPKEITQEQIKAIASARTFWSDKPKKETAESSLAKATGILIPSKEMRVKTIIGPAVITKLEIEPGFQHLPLREQSNKLLRDLVLQIRWNGETEPSVNVPLGDFFGSFERPTRFETLYGGMGDKAFFSAFPMPFEKSADISVRNDGDSAISLAIRATVRPSVAWDDNLGYFHAAWSKSGPEQKGKPHTMLKTNGRGKYVGCFLSTTSKDQSWWMLESNDYMYVDDDVTPSWMGTGLEDYFNSGWYYQNAAARPLAGLLFHAPFKTVQYRLHMNDPVHFNNKIYFEFERGPNHVSRAEMESVVYYYLNNPAAAAAITLSGKDRYPILNDLEEHTLMRELNNQDNIGDLQGAYDHIDEYLERYPDYPHKEMLNLRKLAYREAMNGFDSVKTDYMQVISTSTNKFVVAEAKKLVWFHGDPSHALLKIYCNAETMPFLDGRAYGRYDHPEMAFSIPVVLTPGKHVLCMKSRKTRQMPWLLVHLRTHKENVIQPYTPWRYNRNYQADIHTAGLDVSAWPLTRGGMKGPPEIPFVKLAPNPYVNMLPHSTLLRPTDEAGPDGYTYYRREFTF